MATSQAILDDINLRYRNSFTTDQKLVWFNEEQRELFDVLELDSPPYTFQTVQDMNLYPFPDQFDVTKIKTVTYQTTENTVPEPSFVEVPFLRNDDRQGSIAAPWYTIIATSMFLYIPDTMPDDRTVYIYCDSYPADVTTSTLTIKPDLPNKYQELLKLGTLKRIAMARKDVQMYNNYTADYEQKISDILWQRKLAEPEFVQPIDGNYHPSWQTSYAGWPFVWRG